MNKAQIVAAEITTKQLSVMEAKIEELILDCFEQAIRYISDYTITNIEEDVRPVNVPSLLKGLRKFGRELAGRS
jgi:hypothetical protein